MKERSIAMEVKARIPGQILQVSVSEGDTVEKKQVMAVMEAMKMEQPIPCPVNGTVRQVFVSQGDRVKSGQPLFSVEEL